MNAIQIRNLTKGFGRTPVLEGLHLDLEPGTVLGLLGRNGSGKTTLLKVLIGLYRADAGSASMGSENILVDLPAIKSRVGYIGEGEILPGWASIKDLLALEKGLRPDWDDSHLLAWLSTADLKMGTRAASLSKGLRKRLELELCLAGKPQIILMDEPFDGLDPVSRHDFMQRFSSYLADSNCSVILSSHILSDLERLCDRVAVLAQGRIAYESGLETLKEEAYVLFKEGASPSTPVPSSFEVLGSYASASGRTWVVRKSKGAKAPAGYQIKQADLEELGAELLMSLDPRGESHV